MTKNKKLLISILAVAVVLAAGWWIWNSFYRCSSENPEFCNRNCNVDGDCLPTCGCGCISKSERCYSDIQCFVLFPCKCVNSVCRHEYKQPTAEVTITTNKTEYEQGETVKITVKNNLGKKMGVLDVFNGIEKNENGKWISLWISSEYRCSCDPTCYFGEIPEIDPSKEIIFEWNQKIWTYCNPEASFSDLKNSTFRLVDPGQYRVAVKIDVEKNILYSPEFTIKEKAAIDSRCSKKVQTTGKDCYLPLIGYEFDSSKGKCIEKSTTMCEAEIPFAALEECQKVCETAKGKELPFGTIIKGSSYNHPETKNYVIKSEGEWAGILTKTGAELPAPIDFNKEMVIAVFQGIKRTGGYSIEITKIIENENNIDVFVKEVSPGSGCAVTLALTAPYHIVKVQKSDKEVIFKMESEVTACE